MSLQPGKKRRLLVVSNRLPFAVTQDKERGWQAAPASGGLITAMDPVLREHGGLWIGWPGVTEEVPGLKDILNRATASSKYRVVPVTLTEAERDQFYYGYSNEVIWPLFHDLQSHCNFDPTYWDAYKNVNSRFADTIAKHCRPDDFIWVHDYQLIDVGHSLRRTGYGGKIAFYLHIPFPPLDIFLKLPQQPRLLHSFLQYDLVGFQTQRDRRNFVECVRKIEKDATIAYQDPYQIIRWRGRTIRVGSFPIGIDFRGFAQRASSDEVTRRATEIREGLPGQTLILGVDRLDYTKGIPDRLKAFSTALERHPDLIEKITFIQIVVPSRVDIPKYVTLKTEIERLVGNINGRFARGTWTPVRYYFRSLEQEELLAHYRTAEIALITPHKDGMNLVAKEFCACSLDGNAVLILSQFAGAAEQLHRNAIMINPYDVEQLAEAIYQAFNMPPAERHKRMHKLRKTILEEDVFWWVNSFFTAALHG